MLLSDLLQVICTRNTLHIYVTSATGTYYDTVYMNQLKTRSEVKRLIEKYGKRKVIEIDTGLDEGRQIYIEIER